MILNFSFKNFLSFRDTQQFSFEPISSKKDLVLCEWLRFTVQTLRANQIS